MPPKASPHLRENTILSTGVGEESLGSIDKEFGQSWVAPQGLDCRKNISIAYSKFLFRAIMKVELFSDPPVCAFGDAVDDLMET